MRVMIIDDHPMVIEGCRGILSSEPDIEVLEANTAEQALELYSREEPDVVVLDINLPGISGFELLRQLIKKWAHAKVIVFTMNDDSIFAAQAIERGARGYLTKNEDPRTFIKALRTVAAGERYLSGNLALKLAFSDQHRVKNPLDTLTNREAEILRHLAQGKDIAEIAHILKVSYKTVANTCVLLRRKLGARSKADLLRIAIEQKFAMKLM